MPVRVVDSWVVHDTTPAQLPGLVATGPGEWLLSYAEFPDGIGGSRVMWMRSGDDGRAWSSPETLAVSEQGERGSAQSSLGLSRLRDGALLAPLADILIDDNMTRTARLRLARSNDDGCTWRTHTIALDWREIFPYGALLELDDGALLMPVWGIRTFGERWRSAVMISIDGGVTWSPRASIAYDRFSMIPYSGPNETSIARLRDGRLLAVIRCTRIVGEDTPLFFTSRSDDDGRTWSHYERAGIAGSSPCLARTPAGGLILGYRTAPAPSFDQPGFGVAVRTSEDEGETWSDETPLIDPKGRAPESELDAGYPVIVPLNDGRLLVVFYAYDPDMTWRHPHPEWPAVADAKVQRFLAANVLAER